MKLPRFYPILDTALLARRGLSVVDAARVLLEGGARILQFRHKTHFSRAVYEMAQALARLCRQHGALLVVNDRADMAALLGAGVHLGQHDLPPSEARRLLGPDVLIGYSTHNTEQLAAGCAEPVDYLAVGPIFVTSTKENPAPLVGVEQLKRLRTLTAKPLVAIGGITRANASQVLAAGADSVAVIGDLYPEPATLPALTSRINQWRETIAE